MKYKDIEFKPINTRQAGFRKKQYFLIADITASFQKYGGTETGIIKAIADFIYPDEGEPRFKELFEATLEGDLSKIDYNTDDDENEVALFGLAQEVLTHFLSTRANLQNKLTTSG